MPTRTVLAIALTVLLAGATLAVAALRETPQDGRYRLAVVGHCKPPAPASGLSPYLQKRLGRPKPTAAPCCAYRLDSRTGQVACLTGDPGQVLPAQP